MDTKRSILEGLSNGRKGFSVRLLDVNGNINSISNIIEINNKYNFGEKELINLIKDCKRTPKDIVNTLNKEDWLVATFSVVGSGEGSESGCTIRVKSSNGDKYTLNIRY